MTTLTQGSRLALCATETNAKAGDTPSLLHPPSSQEKGGSSLAGGRLSSSAGGLPSMPKAPASGRSVVGLPAHRSGAPSSTEREGASVSTGKPVSEVADNGGAAKPAPWQHSRPHTNTQRLAGEGTQRGGLDRAAAGCSPGRPSLECEVRG